MKYQIRSYVLVLFSLLYSGSGFGQNVPSYDSLSVINNIQDIRIDKLEDRLESINSSKQAFFKKQRQHNDSLFSLIQEKDDKIQQLISKNFQLSAELDSAKESIALTRQL